MAASKVFSFVLQQLVKWVANILWPWLVENLGPEIRKLVIEIFAKIVDFIRSTIDEWGNNHQKEQEEIAKTKAANAEAMAQSSQSESEAEKHNAVAQVWREIAEQFRQQNEELKAKLDKVLKEASSKFNDDLRAMDLKNVLKEGEDGTLKIAGSATTLRLPSPGDQS